MLLEPKFVNLTFKYEFRAPNCLALPRNRVKTILYDSQWICYVKSRVPVLVLRLRGGKMKSYGILRGEKINQK